MRIRRRVSLTAAVFLTALYACATRRPAIPTLFPVATRWTATLAEPLEGPLATDGQRIFAATRDGKVRALEATAGTPLWEVAGRPGVLSATGSLVVVRQADGVLWGMDPGTGSARWKAGSSIAGTLPAHITGDSLVVAGEGLGLFDGKTGAALWTALPPPRVTAPPVAAGTYLYTAEGEGLVRARDLATGAIAWTFQTAKPILAPVAVDDRGRVLLGTTDRRFLALNAVNGKQRWRWKIGADARHAPLLQDGLVLVVTEEDVLYGLRRSNGHMVWRASLPSRPIAGPLARAGGVVVACHGSRPGESQLVGFNARTGERMGDAKTVAELRGAPLLLGDRLVLPLKNRTVTSVELGVAPPPSPSPSPNPSSEPGTEPSEG